MHWPLLSGAAFYCLLCASPLRAQAKDQRPLTEPTVPPADYGQEMSMHHHHHAIDTVMAHLPKIGQSKNPEHGPVYRLEDLEQMALIHNPTLQVAQHQVEAAQGRKLQAGLFPNPTIGYSGDELRGGSYKSGKQGFFLEQPFITGGKLGLNRTIEDQSIHELEAEKNAQFWRVKNGTRQAYFDVLTAQELLTMKQELADIAHASAEYVGELQNSGQADETELLQSQVEEQRMLAAVDVQKNDLHRAWAVLRAVIGRVELPQGSVAGDIEAVPDPANEARDLQKLLDESPEVKTAMANVARAQAVLVRARREPIPDILFKGGLQQDNEPLGTPQSRAGLVGFAEVGVQLHLFDRNQGNVEAAKAELATAQRELDRVRLLLQSRYAEVSDSYSSARLVALRYRDEILPRTTKAYTLMVKQYGLMNASYSRVLLLQDDLYQAEEMYLQALKTMQIRHVALDGFLYTGGLEMTGMSPSHPTSISTPETSSQQFARPHDLNAPDVTHTIFGDMSGQ